MPKLDFLEPEAPPRKVSIDDNDSYLNELDIYLWAQYEQDLKFMDLVSGLGDDTSGILDEDNINMDIITEANLTITGEWTFVTHPLGLDHLLIANIGSNTHPQIDSHIADLTIHFTEASIDHGSILGLLDDDHTQYLLLAGRGGQSIADTITTQAGRVMNTTRLTNGDSPYTVLATDHIIICDTDGGAITVNLPAGVEGREYRISNVGSSGNDVTVDPNGTEEIFAKGAGIAFVMVDTEGITVNYNATEGWW